MSAASPLAFTCPIGVEPRREIEPEAETDIVVEITAHLASELRRDIPVATRIKIFWARAEALRQAAPHEQIKQQFMALAKRSGLITDLGRHGEEDARHVLDWALRGRIPFESPKPIPRRQKQ
jgi:hypothetical protein